MGRSEKDPQDRSAVADGERQRFLSLLAPLHDRARLTARRLCRNSADGDDLFQEAALRALLRLSDLREEGRFRSWFYAVLLSIHRERERRQRSFLRRFVPFFDSYVDVARDDTELPEPSSVETAETAHGAAAGREDSRGLSMRLTRALAALPAEQREAVVLFEVDGYSLEEVAEMQRASVTAVKTRLFRGRQRLRKHYESQEVDVAKKVSDPPGTDTLPPAADRKEVRHGHG